MQKQSTPKYKQKSLLFVACLPSRTDRNPKKEHMASQRTKSNCSCILKSNSKGASLRNARKDYSEQRAVVRIDFVRNAGSLDFF